MSKRDEARRLQDVITSMRAIKATGLEMVSVDQVLSIADPDSQVPPYTQIRRALQDQKAEQPVIDPRADPITGCLPVTAGSAPDDHPEA